MTLDGIGGPAGAWLIAALALGIAELIVPGVFLIFLAIAAAITGVATLALPDLPAAAQLASFAVWSVVAVMIGQIVTVEAPLRGGHGRVIVGDGSWPARGPDAEIGERLRITAVEGGVVEVAPVAAPFPVPSPGA